MSELLNCASCGLKGFGRIVYCPREHCPIADIGVFRVVTVDGRAGGKAVFVCHSTAEFEAAMEAAERFTGKVTIENVSGVRVAIEDDGQ